MAQQSLGPGDALTDSTTVPLINESSPGLIHRRGQSCSSCRSGERKSPTEYIVPRPFGRGISSRTFSSESHRLISGFNPEGEMALVTASKSLMTLRNLVMYATPLEPPKTTNRNDTQPVIIRIGRPSPIDKLYLFRPTYCSTGCKDSHLRIARCLGDQTKPANSVGVLFQAKTGDARQNGWRVAPMRTFSLLEVVPEAGVEPARGVTAHDFESCMTANSITPARQASL